MELLATRDLIKDDLGNYYTIYAINGSKLTLVNAMVYYSFNRILDEDFVNEVKNNYSGSVAVGQYFQDLVKNRVNGLESGEYPGSIFELEEIKKEYEVELDVFYERNVNV